jgi:hypothetical protein
MGLHIDEKRTVGSKKKKKVREGRRDVYRAKRNAENEVNQGETRGFIPS